MPIPSWPALSVTPALDGWKEDIANDPTLRNKSEGGYTQTRPRFTRIPKKFDFRYAAGNSLTLTDKAALQTFQDQVKVGSSLFTWTNPITAAVYTVRLAKPITFAPMGTTLRWIAEVSLEEA